MNEAHSSSPGHDSMTNDASSTSTGVDTRRESLLTEKSASKLSSTAVAVYVTVPNARSARRSNPSRSDAWSTSCPAGTTTLIVTSPVSPLPNARNEL